MGQMKIITIEKPMLKYFLIFKALLLSSISVHGMDLTSAVKKDSISTEKSVLLIQDQKTVYPGKPLLMSLVLPGAGQYYNKAPVWKTALFFGMELASILAWNNFKNKAESIRKEYQNFADENWSLENWVYNRFNPVNPEWASIPALSSLTGTHDLRLVVSGNLANDFRTRIEILVHAMTESEHDVSLLLDAGQKVWNVLDVSDAFEHLQHRLVGAAVKRSVEGTHRAGDGTKHVDAARRQVSARRRAAIHLVFGVEQKHDVHRLGELRVRSMSIVQTRVEHVQKVFGVRHSRVRRRRRSSRVAMIRVRGECRHLPNDSHDLFILNRV